MLARRLYTAIFYLSLPVILLRLLWRARKNPGYAQRWGERLGYFPYKNTKKTIWVHAVSVGEALAAVPIIKALQRKYPAFAIVVTTTTPTGAERVQAVFKDSVTLLYLPYDLPFALKRFLDTVRPQMGILMETELWPNLLYLCGQQNIPIFVANARLSARSARGYGRISSITRMMLKNVTQMAVQTQVEAERFIALGLDPKRVQVTGSIKYDLEIPEDLFVRATALKDLWGQQRSVLIAASTHEHEEEQVLLAYKKIIKTLPNLLLVLVPRHPDRFERVINLVKKHGCEMVLRSENKACTSSTQVFIGDSMGELLLFYAASDIAFVGGSLVATGGHNPLEPAALSIPVLMGPHFFNFTAITEQLQQAEALKIIQDSDQLAEQVLQILTNETQRRQMGENGRSCVAKNRGALAKHLTLIDSFLM